MAENRRPLRILISSTMQDLTVERQEIADVITSSKHAPLLAEKILDVENSPRRAIEKMVDECDCYIGVFHKRWGYVPVNDNPEKLSVTAIEYERALENELPRLILISEEQKEPELEKFLERIGDFETGQWRTRYSNLTDLVKKVALGIAQLEASVRSKSKDVTSLKDAIHNYSNRIKETIMQEIAGREVRPVDLDQIVGFVNKNRKVWIVGERGIGKSVILRKIFDNLTSTGKTVLLLRADEILSKKEFYNVTRVEEIGVSLDELSAQITKNEDLYILIDSVDGISRNYDVWLSFVTGLLTLQSNPRVHTVLTIRKSDFDAFPYTFPPNWGEIISPIGFTSDQVLELLSKLGIKDKISEKLYSILRIPFYMNILATIVARQALTDYSDITNESHFLQEHYNRIIRNNDKDPKLAQEKVDLLCKLTEKMREHRMFRISHNSFPATPAFQSLRSDGVIVEDQYFVRFFHDMYFDFVVSFKITDKGPVSKFLEKVQEDLFLKSTINFTLGYLKGKDEQEYLSNLRDILTSAKVSFYWKRVAMELVCTLKEATVEEQKLLESVLNADSSLQGTFFEYLIEKRNPIWYTYWAKTVFRKWAVDSNFQHRATLANYIKIAVQGDTDG